MRYVVSAANMNLGTWHKKKKERYAAKCMEMETQDSNDYDLQQQLDITFSSIVFVGARVDDIR